jgi:hypothetical protein
MDLRLRRKIHEIRIAALAREEDVVLPQKMFVLDLLLRKELAGQAAPSSPIP